MNADVLHTVYVADDECTEDCPACHFPGNTCPIAPGDCDLCEPDDYEPPGAVEGSGR